jgi:hypothetical protein
VLKKAVKSPVLHFLDTGLCTHLLKWGSAETLEAGPMSGAFFESWVFSEIYRSYPNMVLEPPLFYYRDTLLSGQIVNRFSWLRGYPWGGMYWLAGKACCKGIFSERVTDKICSKV